MATSVTPAKRHWRWRILGAFLALLVLSHVVRWAWPAHGRALPGQQHVEVPVYDDEGAKTGEVTALYYQDLRPAGKPDAPVVLLIHGSPMSPRMLDGMAQLLAADFRVVVPDLPGFGASAGPELPDYSLETQAKELASLVEQLKLERVNLVGYSMGGGTALELADLMPARIESVALVASIGPVEFEWLGDPVLNRALYGAQLGALVAAREFTPHFGMLDTWRFSTAYAHTFFDTNHRRIREVLKRYTGPLLIIHGQTDFFTPVAAAQEARRLAPQSELALYASGHGEPLLHPEVVTARVHDFVTKAHAGLAQVKAAADPRRLAESVKEMPRRGPTGGAYEAMLLALLFVATYLAEDLTCIAAGLLVARGVLGFWPAMWACYLGIHSGDAMLYAVGRYFGRPALAKAPLKWWIKEADVKRLENSFHQKGSWIVFISRFVPATRLPVFVGAGVLHFSFIRMTLALLVANALWTPPFVWISAKLGEQMIALVEKYEKGAFLMVVVVGVAVVVVTHVILPLCTWRGRRLLLSRWRRLTRWEFWPWWITYVPVFGYWLWLGKKYRSLTVFTCANPALPAGGFAGESKSEILRGLAGAGDAVARWTLLPAVQDKKDGAARMETLANWMQQQGFTWPVVLKPEVGERGQGVAVCRTEAHAQKYLTENPAAIIAQEYVPGVEYGVFYYRYPKDASGHLLAITDKRIPAVTGDGWHKLWRLILADERAVCSARFFLARHASRLEETPAQGEVVPLTDLGTHSRGAMFLDGTTELATPKLTAAIDEISKKFDGFYFGRYDVRCPSREDLQEGRNLKVIELNGVTSEATAIYDPKRTLTDAWLLLFQQWEICFKIGAENRTRGAKPASLREAFRALVDSRTAEKYEA